MRQPQVKDGKAFVVAHRKVGQILGQGPITGEPFRVTIQGNWIDEDDAEVLVEQVKAIYCFRSRSMMEIHPIVYA
jgi:hypothetical protein